MTKVWQYLGAHVPHSLATALLGVVAFLLWLHWHDAAVSAQALHDAQAKAALQRTEAVDSVVRALTPRLLALQGDSARLAQREAAYRVQLGAALGVISSTQARLDSALAATADSGLRVVITARLAQDSAAIHSCSLALNAADSSGTVCGQRLAAIQLILGVTRTALDSTTAALKVQMKAAHPGLFGAIRTGVPWAAAGVLLAVVLRL